MEILIVICAIVLCVIVGIVAYNKGKAIPIQESKINNDKLKQEQEQLTQENKRLQENIRQSQQTIKEADDLKANMLKNAEDAYQQRVAHLEKEYFDKQSMLEINYTNNEKHLYDKLQQEEERLNNILEGTKTVIEEEKKKLEDDLNKMRKAHKATVESSRRTAAVQENKDDYRLIINAADASDIKTIESIRHLLVKPRILSMLIWQTYYQPLTKKIFPKILGQNKVCGIYKITNTETQECYIGQAVDIRDRWNQHCKCGLGIDTPAKNKLYQAIQEYGLDKFTFELLEECESSELNKREKYYIDMFNSVDYGYNGNVGQNV